MLCQAENLLFFYFNNMQNTPNFSKDLSCTILDILCQANSLCLFYVLNYILKQPNIKKMRGFLLYMHFIFVNIKYAVKKYWIIP